MTTSFGSAIDSSPDLSIWDWDYESESGRLSEHYARAVAGQWNPDASINWSQTVDPARVFTENSGGIIQGDFSRRLSGAQKETMRARAAVESFSQILHGEQAALVVSSQLVTRVSRHDLRMSAATQVMDEARHVEIFSRYVRRIGEIHPPSPSLRRVIDKIARAPHWACQMVGMQVVVEALAMTTFARVRRSTACPLLASLLDLVVQDEARHMQFGRTCLSDALVDMPEDERIALEDFALEIVLTYRAWGASAADLVATCQLLIEIGLDPTDFLRANIQRLERGEPVDPSDGLRESLDRLIVPSLARLGIITARTRDRYLAAGITTAAMLDSAALALAELIQ